MQWHVTEPCGFSFQVEGLSTAVNRLLMHTFPRTLFKGVDSAAQQSLGAIKKFDKNSENTDSVIPEGENLSCCDEIRFASIRFGSWRNDDSKLATSRTQACFRAQLTNWLSKGSPLKTEIRRDNSPALQGNVKKVAPQRHTGTGSATLEQEVETEAREIPWWTFPQKALQS